MIYSLKRITHNLKRHLPVYLLFVLLFAVGILILCSALNVLVSLQKNLTAKKEELAAENAIEIIYESCGMDSGIDATSMKQSMSVSYDMYLKLVEKYKDDFTFQYGVETKAISGAVINPEFCLIPEVNVWFVNNELFQAYFGVPMEEDTMYAGENAYEVLCQMKEWADHPEQYQLDCLEDNVIWIENGEYTVAKKDAYKLTAMPLSEKTEIKPSIPDDSVYNDYEADGTYYVPDLVNCIFIPMSAFPIYEELIDSIDWEARKEETNGSMSYYETLLKAQYKNTDFKTETMSEMLSFLMKENHLKERGWTVEFTLGDRELEQQKYAETVQTGMKNYVIMAVSILLVVSLGTTGLFLIFLYRRKKQMAVAIAYGATKQRLFGELFMEIFVITCLGATLGLWALQFTAEFFLSFYAETTFQISCMVIAFVIAALTALFTAILAFAGVGEIAPTKLLKEL